MFAQKLVALLDELGAFSDNVRVGLEGLSSFANNLQLAAGLESDLGLHALRDAVHLQADELEPAAADVHVADRARVEINVDVAGVRGGPLEWAGRGRQLNFCVDEFLAFVAGRDAEGPARSGEREAGAQLQFVHHLTVVRAVLPAEATGDDRAFGAGQRIDPAGGGVQEIRVKEEFTRGADPYGDNVRLGRHADQVGVRVAGAGRDAGTGGSVAVGVGRGNLLVGGGSIQLGRQFVLRVDRADRLAAGEQELGLDLGAAARGRRLPRRIPKIQDARRLLISWPEANEIRMPEIDARINDGEDDALAA